MNQILNKSEIIYIYVCVCVCVEKVTHKLFYKHLDA